MSVRVKWDSRKAAVNLYKHGISFDEASTVFDDSLATIFPDEDHSMDEIREIIIGHSIRNRLLIVSFTELEPDIIRINSARSATGKEKSNYEKHTR